MQKYNLEPYEHDHKVGARGYRGIRVSGSQIFITSIISKEYLETVQSVGVEYDKEKKAIRLTPHQDANAGIPLRKGVSYAHYIPARLTDVGMPQGRYYLEEKAGKGKLLFVYRANHE